MSTSECFRVAGGEISYERPSRCSGRVSVIQGLPALLPLGDRQFTKGQEVLPMP